jgi:predicted anti-sigma-YlaC factor YlaD
VLVSSGFTIQEGEALNRNVERTPWVGVYYGALALAPHTLGSAQPWRAELELLLYVQEASHRSGQEATRRLGAAQAAVLDVLNAQKTLAGAVTMIGDLAVIPFQRDLEHETWLFTNEIALRAELRG